MRIIAGLHRTRAILGPDGEQTTRPVTDRVKQSLFDRLWSLGVFENQPLQILDLFAGTGSLGLEALSRALDNPDTTDPANPLGAPHCTFVERDRSARQRLDQNLATLNMAEYATVLGSDALSGSLVTLLRAPIHLITLDPPYRMVENPKTAARVGELLDSLHAVAVPETIAMLRAPSESEPPAVSPEYWTAPDSHRYGGMTLHFYFRA